MTMTAEKTTPMTATAGFPVTTGRTKGYQRKAVDAFLARARTSFEARGSGPRLTAADIRAVTFPLVRNGYAVAAVDAALGRVEDAFAARARGDAIASDGRNSWVAQHRAVAQGILDRSTFARGRRFRRVAWPKRGYRIDEVDVVVDRLAAYFADGRPVTVQQIRSVAFRTQRHGYSEAQVDSMLDTAVDVILAVG